MKLSFILVQSKIIFFTLLILIVSCNNSGSPELQDTKQLNIEKLNHEKNISIIDNTDSILDTITCLDISFIEALEFEWENSYGDSMLTKKGFVNQSSNMINHGKEIIFVNKILENKIKLVKLEFLDGEICFKVEYSIKQQQFECFKNSLASVNYSTSSNNNKFKKKGLGTYEEKIIEFIRDDSLIIFTHKIGKEIQAPSILVEDLDLK
jgi:hypothetical protein